VYEIEHYFQMSLKIILALIHLNMY